MGPPLYPSPLKYRSSLCMVWGLNLRPKPQILHHLPLELGLGGQKNPILGPQVPLFRVKMQEDLFSSYQYTYIYTSF
ncbi:hypothetical protein H5410_053889 [Solanum commersonii]|uniref:Uncharacterized protein n=1 Tax=Solanum commersonii TaxID=4109 RepID=A0A9J5X7M9_SOLCO|nr:hypothetical protein H5410_053889 [Solanum commersonii]